MAQVYRVQCLGLRRRVAFDGQAGGRGPVPEVTVALPRTGKKPCGSFALSVKLARDAAVDGRADGIGHTRRRCGVGLKPLHGKVSQGSPFAPKLLMMAATMSLTVMSALWNAARSCGEERGQSGRMAPARTRRRGSCRTVRKRDAVDDRGPVGDGDVSEDHGSELRGRDVGGREADRPDGNRARPGIEPDRDRADGRRAEMPFDVGLQHTRIRRDGEAVGGRQRGVRAAAPGSETGGDGQRRRCAGPRRSDVQRTLWRSVVAKLTSFRWSAASLPRRSGSAGRRRARAH